jgi:hypothetical protein
MDTQSQGASAPLQATQPAIFQFHSVEVRTVLRKKKEKSHPTPPAPRHMYIR